jgi:hypothetical protein
MFSTAYWAYDWITLYHKISFWDHIHNGTKLADIQTIICGKMFPVVYRVTLSPISVKFSRKAYKEAGLVPAQGTQFIKEKIGKNFISKTLIRKARKQMRIKLVRRRFNYMVAIFDEIDEHPKMFDYLFWKLKRAYNKTISKTFWAVVDKTQGEELIKLNGNVFELFRMVVTNV